MCHDLTKTVDSLELKVKKLKSDRSKLVQENNSLETKLEKVKNSPFSECEKCQFLSNDFLKLKTDLELLKSENMNLKNENRDFEKEIEKFKESEKLDFEKRKQFEIEISKSNAKIKALENENLILKQTDAEKRKIAINRCSNLIKENSDLKFKIQRLESALTKFSKGEKSLNMLLKNHFFVQNKKGLGF